ncbi:MAG: family 43 glycosylhydrolase [Spirochaetales bacterium]|nr:family 43 glycosylhydrolase [Spirochaetales bacterium]
MISARQKNSIFIFLFVFFCAIIHADNPLITNYRTADPNPFVYNDRFYIICGQDEVNPSTFKMYAWRLLSSSNMRDWTDHGQILRPDQVSWMPNDAAWASTMVYKNNYFYLYTADTWQIGVFRSRNVTGPWEDVLGRPLIDKNTPGHAARDIDPMCFIDDDGQAYLFWGGDGNCRYARLSSDMISLTTSVMDVPGLTNYLEAPFVIKENGLYFLMYATSPWPSEIRYATSNRITGPWTHRGVIGSPTGSGTNHEGAAYFKGQWWYTYHTEELSNNNPYSRSVCVDKMYIDGDSIRGITYTDNSGGGVIERPNVTPPPEKQEAVWSGNSYTFNGSSDYVSLPKGVMNDFFDFTIAGYVKLDTITMWARIFDFGADASFNMFLTPRSDGNTFRFAITQNGNSGEQRINAPELAVGSWQHFAIVKSGNRGVLYLNGKEAGRNNAMSFSPVDLGDMGINYLGRSQYDVDPYLDGEIDHFYIYNRAITQGEIDKLVDHYPGTTLTVSGDVDGNNVVNIVDSLLIAQYYVGLNPQNFNAAEADVNCSGKIDIVDALLIAQQYVGLITSFDC